MAWCPFAVHKPLSENHTQGRIAPRAIILHRAVSSSSSLFGFFQNNSNLESHFYVNEQGVIEQYMDTQIMADANKNANSFAVSIESWDGGAASSDAHEWNAAITASLIRLCDWLCDVHPIPRVQIPTATGAGIGWHVMFGAPGPWTPVSKSCPGWARINQVKNVIIPRVAAGGIVVEEDVELTDSVTWWDGKSVPVKDIFAEIYIAARAVNGKPAFAGQTGVVPIPAVDAVKADTGEIRAKVDNLSTGGVDVNALAQRVAEIVSSSLGDIVADELSRRLES